MPRHTPPPCDCWLSVAEVAARLGVNRTVVNRMIEDGRLPATAHPARTLWVTAEDADAAARAYALMRHWKSMVRVS